MRTRVQRYVLAALAGIWLALPGSASVQAQGWNPFDPFGTQQKRPEPKKPPSGAPGQYVDDVVRPIPPTTNTIEMDDLAPVMSTDGSGLPYEVWSGLDLGRLEQLISEVDIPPRSPALQQLWQRLITTKTLPPSGSSAEQQFFALRLELLFRSGLIDETATLLSAMPMQDPVVAALAARNEIGRGAIDSGCRLIQSPGAATAQLPKPVKIDVALISGLCAIAAGDAPGAGLAASLAREAGAPEGVSLAALDAYSMGAKPSASGDTMSLIDFRLLQSAGGTVEPAALVKAASPALLAALASDRQADAALRLAAAEAAVQRNAISPEQLADAYRAQPREEAIISDADGTDTPRRRAALFNAAESEGTPQRKVRLIRSFLDDARRAGFYLAALRMIAPATDTISPAPEIGWFAETGVEVAVASGRYDKARSWATFGSAPNGAAGNSLNHWLALIDIAEERQDHRRGDDLAYVEQLAVDGRLDPTLLHRLATVLDALEYNVPIPLWEAASRTPQPAGGFLPETGVLSELQDAAKKREFGRTVLLAMRTIGPNGAENTHMIALGDSLRALKRAGLESDARHLGFEALFTSWPRALSN
jgi:hypothetical protein